MKGNMENNEEKLRNAKLIGEKYRN